MPSLRLPRMQSVLRLVKPGTGTPDFTFIQWWNEFANQIEASVNNINAALEAAGIAQAAADAAQAAANTAETAANNAQDAVDGVSNTLSVVDSGININPLSASDAGTDATITIAAHQRTYADGTTVDVDGSSLNGLAYETLYYIFYVDPSRLGGAVSYQSTTVDSEAAQVGDRHLVGRVTTPASGAPPSTGDYIRLPGLGTLEP